MKVLHEKIVKGEITSEALVRECLAHGQDLLESSEEWSGLLNEEKYLKARADADDKGKALIDNLMTDMKLDCLVTACSRITSFAAVRGTCSLVVPAVEFNTESYEPVSYFLIGKPFGEKRMIQVGYALEQMAGVRNKPEWVQEF